MNAVPASITCYVLQHVDVNWRDEEGNSILNCLRENTHLPEGDKNTLMALLGAQDANNGNHNLISIQ